MTLVDDIRNRIRANLRAFVLGPGVVEPWQAYYGVDPETYSPPEYGNYIATSNGVYACVTLRAELLSSLPLKLYKQPQNGDRVEVERGQLYELLRYVNPFWTMNRLLQMTEMSLGLWGEAYWFLERGESGRQPPKEIWWGRPDRVRVVLDETDYIKAFVYQPTTGMAELMFQPEEVIWMPLPNPLDEFTGLSPLAAARLAADVASAAMKSNFNLFDQGMQMGGYVFPKEGTWTKDQATDMRDAMDKRFKGVEKAHRWGAFRQEVGMGEVGITPKDAEFLGAMQWSLEDICRAYSVPLDLLGGQRTYQNYDAAMKAVWQHAIIPQGRFIASELMEKLAPMFPGQADALEFDHSGVEVLQEAEAERWARANEQLERGAITINQWRDEQGMEPVPWGDSAWLPLSLVPIESSEAIPISAEKPPPSEAESEAEVEAELERIFTRQAVEYGSPEHELLWRRFVRRADRYETLVARDTVKLFERLRDSVLSRLNERGVRGVEEIILNPFNKSKWTKIFRETLRRVITFIFGDAGNAALEELGLTQQIDMADPNAIRFLEASAQRFAEPVLDTTWKMLKKELAEGLNKAEGIPQLAERVERVMGDRIRSSKETIARTEAIRAQNAGTLEAWKQSGVVESKTWLAALDGRERDTHGADGAHGQTVPLNADFIVGAGQGPAPGQIGIAEEDIQ